MADGGKVVDRAGNDTEHGVLGGCGFATIPAYASLLRLLVSLAAIFREAAARVTVPRRISPEFEEQAGIVWHDMTATPTDPPDAAIRDAIEAAGPRAYPPTRPATNAVTAVEAQGGSPAVGDAAPVPATERRTIATAVTGSTRGGRRSVVPGGHPCQWPRCPKSPFDRPVTTSIPCTIVGFGPGAASSPGGDRCRELGEAEISPRPGSAAWSRPIRRPV